MNRRPNQVASAVPVSSARNAVVTWTRRRNDCWTRMSVTRTRAETMAPSGAAWRSSSVRISRRSSYRRGRWNSRSRTVSTPSRRPERRRTCAAPSPDRPTGWSSSSTGSVGTGAATLGLSARLPFAGAPDRRGAAVAHSAEMRYR